MKDSIEIKKISIINLETDAIVNAANEQLAAGGGVCGAIFDAAGYRELQKACDAYSHCNTGDAVITPGFKLKAKYIIHAVGPIWHGGKCGEPEKLRSAYKKSLEIASEYNCKSIGFPLISAGIYGYPTEDAWREAFNGCKEFFESHTDSQLKIIFAVLNNEIMATGKKILDQIISSPSENRHETAQGHKNENEKLIIGNRVVDAVFFHKPEEPNGYLSNWYISPFNLDGVHFSSVEQYIMYKKCQLFGDTISAEKILSTDDTETQQNIGRHAIGYIDSIWSGMRQIFAYEGLKAKFSQNEDLKQKLLETGDAFLVECANSDKIWACGISLYDNRRLNESNWDGKNTLGFILMRVRDTLK